MEITQQLEEVPDPRILGTKIIFDSRLDEFSQLKDKNRLVDNINQQSQPRPTHREQKEDVGGKFDDDDFNDESSKISFKKKDAEADSGEMETSYERIRNVQQSLINFKRELAKENIPIEFLDFILYNYQDHFTNESLTSEEIDEFFKFLKAHIQNLKFEVTLPKPFLKSEEEYDLKYMLKSSESKEAYQSAMEELNPKFVDLKEPALKVIENSLWDLYEDLNKKSVNPKYQVYGMHKGLNILENNYREYVMKASSGVKVGVK